MAWSSIDYVQNAIRPLPVYGLRKRRAAGGRGRKLKARWRRWCKLSGGHSGMRQWARAMISANGKDAAACAAWLEAKR